MTTVVFDLGQVLIKWDPYRAQEGFLTREEWENFTVRTNFWGVNTRLDAGEPVASVRSWFARRYPEDVEIFDRYVARYPATLRGPVPGVFEIVDDLLAYGARTAVLSNWPAELFHHALAHIPAIDRLGMRIVSGEVGFAKPDRRIFELLLSRLGCDPGEIVFIDDNVDNVEAAAMLGIDAIRFVDANQLRTELTGRGLVPTMGLGK